MSATSSSAAIDRIFELAKGAAVTQPHYLNLALSDGTRSVACRVTNDKPGNASTLFVHAGKRYTCDGGLCRMVEPGEDGHAVIVSSEPLSRDPGWESVAANEMILIERTGGVTRRPLHHK